MNMTARLFNPTSDDAALVAQSISGSRDAFARRLSQDLGKPVVATADWESCVRGADIVVEASRLSKPAPMLRTGWIAPGAFVVSPESRLVQVMRGQLAREQGREIQLVLGRSVADTNHFAVHGGVPTLICGPQGGNTCEANEYLELSSLLPTARALAGGAVELLGGLS